MARLRLLTAGESHGPGVLAILEGLPHGLLLERDAIDVELGRRQTGYGRGGRMKIERDEVEVLSGLRGGRTLGSPLALLVRNRDHASWVETMDPWTGSGAPLTRPRPGHADLAGALKLGLTDARDVLERASARSTVARVAAGAVCARLLSALGVELFSHVVRIGPVEAPPLPSGALGDFGEKGAEAQIAARATWAEARARVERSEVRCFDEAASAEMIAAIALAQRAGDSLGGVVEVVALGLPPGLGSHVEWDQRLDGRLAQALMSIPSVKAVELGLGLAAAARRGSEVHDPILWAGGDGRFTRPTNHAGGIEGGNSNGEPVVARAACKPIPTLARPLPSVDLATKAPFSAQKERTDSCAVPAAAVIAEAAVAFVLADALLEKTGGDALAEVARNLEAYRLGLGRG